MKGFLARLRAAENSVEQAEGLFRTTFEQAAVGIAHVRPDGRFLRINQTFCDLVGYTREEMLRRTFQDITHPDDLSEDLQFVRRMLSGEIGTYSMEKRYLRKDGDVVWVSLTVSLVRDRSNKPDYFISVVEEIGEKKLVQWKLEEKTRELAERLKELHCLYSVTETRTREDLAFEDVLRRVVALVPAGFQDPEAAECSLVLGNRTFTTERFRESSCALSSTLEDSGEPMGSLTVVYRTAPPSDGCPAFLEEEQRLLDEIGRQISLFFRRTEMEAELREARDRAEEASRLKSVLLANVSHELRTPMNSILGYTTLLLDGIDGPILPEQEASLTKVKRNAERLLHLINELLDFSRIDAGRLPLSRQPFSLREVVLQAVRTLDPMAGRKALELTYSVEPDVPDILIGDGPRLEEVVLNLGENAIKFTPQGSVSLSVAEELPRRDGVLLHFTVTDTGIGVPLDKQTLIFDAFAQAHAAEMGKHQGIGLGLAISSELVSMMGGRIWVESEPEAGSTFHFTAQFLQPPSEEVPFRPAGSA